MERCDPWPLNPKGELLLGVKLESPEGVANCEAILAVPGLGFAEIGPGDLSLSLGYRTIPREPYPPEMQAARDRVLRGLPQQRHRFPAGLHAGQHDRPDRRGRAGDRGALARHPPSRVGHTRSGNCRYSPAGHSLERKAGEQSWVSSSD